MQSKTKATVFARKIEFLEDAINFDSRERVIRRKEFAKIVEVEDYAKHLAGLLVSEREESKKHDKDLVDQKIGHVNKEASAVFLKSIEAFHKLQQRYLDSVENQCKQVVSKVFTQLTGTVSEEQQLTALVKQAVRQVAGEPKATLICNPSQKSLIEKLQLPSLWVLRTHESIETNTCAVQVPLGEYRFSFQANIEAMQHAFMRV